MKIAHSNIVTAFKKCTIGTQVVRTESFLEALNYAVESHNSANDRRRGQHVIQMPPETHAMVRGGIGLRTNNSQDYVVRSWRGKTELYLDRHFSLPVLGVTAIVYTADAYLADPEVTPGEKDRVKESTATHVLVAVLASTGMESPLTPDRLVANLAGGNNETLDWSREEIFTKARESSEYWQKFCVVADRNS